MLSVLDWRLRSITPFSFIYYFACKLDSTGTNYAGFLVSRASEIILSNMQGNTDIFCFFFLNKVMRILHACTDVHIPYSYKKKIKFWYINVY